MMKQAPQKLRDMLTRMRGSRVTLFALVVAAFVAGHFTMDSYVSVCRAQQPPLPMVVPPVIGGTCFLSIPPACNPVLCEDSNTSEDAVDAIWDPFHDTLVDLTAYSPDYTATKRDGTTFVSGHGLEGFADGIVDAMTYALMDRLNDIELGYMDWFDTMWFYNLKPAYMDQTDQINTATADQTRTFQGGQDAGDSDNVNIGHMQQQQSDARVFRLSENGACTATGAAGGSQRGYNLSREMKKSLQKETTENDALGRRGTPAAKGRAAKAAARTEVFENVFCSATDNDGAGGCAGTPLPGVTNYDISPSRLIYGTLTIPMHDTTAVGGVPAGVPNTRGAVYEAATKELITNMTGDPTQDALPKSTMKSAQAVETFVDRRSFVARVAAVRSVPQLGISWRTPGTRLADMIKEIRNEGGTPSDDCPSGGATVASGANAGAPCEISDNPSYKEVMHAVSVDRFTTGRYANDMTTNESDIEMEKLTIESFYLMQLRDYYELMERMALTLAVQVAVLSEQVPVAQPQGDRPK